MSTPSDSTKLQQLQHDTSRTEHLLLQRASQTLPDSNPAQSRTQAAAQLITHLRLRAEQHVFTQGDDKQSHATLHRYPQAAQTQAAIEANQEALKSVFSQEVLTELCNILHNLYLQQAQLQVQPSSHIANVGQPRTGHSICALQQDSRPNMPAASRTVQLIGLQPLQLESAPQHLIDTASEPLCSTAVQTDADLQQQDETALLRYLSTLSYRFALHLHSQAPTSYRISPYMVCQHCA